MDWIIASLLMFLSSIVLYLFIRKAQIIKIPIEIYSLGMFGVPAVLLALIIFFSKYSFHVSLDHFLKLLIASIFFSWLGNVFSQRSILYAPNPGYALIISKSYVVFTSIVAVFLFGSELTLLRSLAILMIVGFSIPIILQTQKDNKNNVGVRWIFHSFGAFFAWAFLALMSTHLLRNGLNEFTLLFYLFLIVSTLIFIETKVRKAKMDINPVKLLIILVIGVSSLTFNLFMQIGFKNGPNPGYINAVNASSISMVTLLSAYFFKDELTFRKILGVFGVTAGLVLLFL